jgi:hypothetical protein
VHVVLTDVNDEQLDCTLGMLVSTDCKLEAEPVPFGNKLPVVISSAEVVRVNIVSKTVNSKVRIYTSSYKYC